MFIKENILLSIAGIRSSKMRSLLTMLGIIIGISSVIGIVSIGSAITSTVSTELNKIGANNMEVLVMERTSEEGYHKNIKEPEDSDCMSLEQIDIFKEAFSDKISNVSISESQGEGKVKDGYLYANVNINGVNEDYKDVTNVKMISGRFISEKDMKGMKKSAVVSDTLVNSIFKGKTDVLGKEIKVYVKDNIETYVIVGVYKYEKPSILEDRSNLVSKKDTRTELYIPVTTEKVLQKKKNYKMITISPKSGIDSGKLVKDIEKYTDKLYKNNKNWQLFVYNNKDEAASYTKILNLLSIAVSIIAAIALLVGGIGVMNIMLVSVTERTREIGTRKALGAKTGHIKMQFITESVILCTIGGTIGIIFGVGMGIIACLVLKSPISISIPTILVSFTFSMAIGVFFGYYPAKKAASLDPIEALRYE
ncbi:MAG: ABC-type antimicrobial peptide transport system, permease component [Clostridiaceae bacterium]|jgi:putative ABC transport system permease protein|nr:ABC-type antimicrobial peptide transport system, permease component [Clostridiaceae bacterium]